MTPLPGACIDGHLDCVDRLYTAGADINSRDSLGAAPIQTAAARNKTDVVTALLDWGEDVNKVGEVQCAVGLLV